MTEQEQYPEHAKLREVHKLSQACGEFIDWLEEQGIHLAEYVVIQADPNDEDEEPLGRAIDRAVDGVGQERLVRTHKRRTALLAGFFGIDELKLEAEKRAMIDELQRPREVSR